MTNATSPIASLSLTNGIIPGQGLRTFDNSRLLSDVKKGVLPILEALKSTSPLDLGAYELPAPQVGYFSTLAICTKGADAVGVLIILGASAPAPQALVETWNGVQFRTERVPADAYDADLLRKVAQPLAAFNGGQPVDVIGCIALPEGFDHNDPAALQEVVYSACNTIVRQTFSEDKLGVLNLSQVTDKEMLSVRGQAGAVNEVGADGQPVFSTMRFQVIASPKNVPGAAGSLNGRAPVMLTEASAVIDMLYSPTTVNLPMGGTTTKYFTPRVIARLKSLAGGSLESYLLALVSMTALSDNSLWMSPFLQTDVLNPGMLAIESNLNGNFDAPMEINASFGPAQLKALLDAKCLPDLVYSIAIGRHGVYDAAQEVFVEASKGVPEAAKRILTAANNLTGGRFMSLYRGTTPVLVNGSQATGNADISVRGKFMNNADGRWHDVAEVDNYVGILNLLQRTGQERMIQVYTNTWMDHGQPTRPRLAERINIVQQALGTAQMKVTNYDRLVTIEGAFLSALASGVTNSGVTLAIDVNNAFQATGNRVAAPAFFQGASMSGGLKPVMRTGSGGNMASW